LFFTSCFSSAFSLVRYSKYLDAILSEVLILHLFIFSFGAIGAIDGAIDDAIYNS